jgi:glycosyltransferase involved in cell wall biosynthesis
MLLHLARELLRKGHEVVAFGPEGGSGWLTGRLRELGVQRRLIPVRGYRGAASVVLSLSREIREQQLDVLHSHEFAMSVFGAPASSLAGCRHVITMHGSTYFAEHPRRLTGLRLASTLSDHTVAVSSALRRSLAEHLRVSPRAIRLVRNGVDALSGSNTGVRGRLGIGSEEILAVAVGSLYPVKGHSVLIDAVAEMLPSTRPVVAIAGSGFEKDSLRARIRSRGVEDRVLLLGYRSDVPDLLAAADIYVMPSLSEGLPMAMIEAMLAGRPVLASDVGGIGELIPSDEFGVLVPPGDPDALKDGLLRLAADPALRTRLGAAARRRAEAEFTAATMADQYVRLYEG